MDMTKCHICERCHTLITPQEACVVNDGRIWHKECHTLYLIDLAAM